VAVLRGWSRKVLPRVVNLQSGDVLEVPQHRRIAQGRPHLADHQTAEPTAHVGERRRILVAENMDLTRGGP